MLMLYKKYHRNFVKQFKKGVKFKWSGISSGIGIVKKEPYYNYAIYVTDSKHGLWNLVNLGGEINKYLYVV